jgi:phage-related protein
MSKVKNPTTKPVYVGVKLRIEFYQTVKGEVAALDWLESQREIVQQKFAALFTWIGDHGKIWNERKFKHLTGTSQIFEFKADEARVLCFFFTGQRLILTHGFVKKGDKTLKAEIERAEIIKAEFLTRESK